MIRDAEVTENGIRLPPEVLGAVLTSKHMFRLIRQGVAVFVLVTYQGIAHGQSGPPSHGENTMTAQEKNRPLVIGKTEISTDVDWVYHVAWSPDSKHFAALGAKGSGDHTVYSVVVYDSTSRRAIQMLPIKRPGSISGDIAFSPDGKYLAAGIGVIALWETHTWQPVREIKGPYERGIVSGGVQSLAFSPDGRSLAVLYESVTWPETVTIATKEEGAAWVNKETASKKDGTYWEKLARGEILSHVSTIMVFDVETAKRTAVQAGIRPTAERAGRFTGNLAYTPNGTSLLASRVEHHHVKPGDHSPRIRTFLEVRDPRSGQIVKEIEGVHVMHITAVAVSPDGRFAATGTETLTKISTLNQPLIDNRDPVRLWDLSTGQLVKEYGPLRGGVKALRFSPNGKVLVSCQNDLENKETVWLWDVQTAQLLERVRTPRSGHEFFGCAISANGRTVAAPILNSIYLIDLQP